MRLKQALIEGGVAYGNPGMEHPSKTAICDEFVNCFKAVGEKCECDMLRDKWHSGRLPFEEGSFKYSSSIPLHIDGLYSVDLDVTVVEQRRKGYLKVDGKYVKNDGAWEDKTDRTPHMNYEYRKVLRIN